MIGIVNYGVGNLLSVYNAIDFIGEDVVICNTPEELIYKDKIILPGVGSFKNGMSNLVDRGFYETLEQLVVNEKRPILGICLGMQLMADKSFEGGEHKGFGWIDGDVVPINNQNSKLKIPHVGWNNINIKSEKCLLSGLPKNPDVYFVHSYYMKCKNNDNVIATCEYGDQLTASISKDNIFGTQFHPEKSQDYGIRILENFCSI
jgi:imidazole glycerol-phosphate synthase subunit HisH